MSNEKHDVIVVGAGPIGSYTAYQLAKTGLNVGIFEKNLSIGEDVNCTGLISEECFKHFDLPREAILRQVDSIKAYSPSGNYIRYQSASPLAYIVNRSLFDQEMNRMAVREGVTTYLNTRVEEITIMDDSFHVKVKTGEEENKFSSKVGVIATGFDLNSLREGVTKPGKYLYGVQTDARTEDISDVEVYFGRNISPGSFAWVVPTHNKEAKIGLITKKNPLDYLKNFIENPLISHRVDMRNSQVKCSPIPFGVAPKSYAERLIVVGEAAGQVKTTTGGGIYFGLLCSEIAVKTIMNAFAMKDFSEKVFKEYEISWRNRIEPELNAGMLLRNLFSRLSDYQINLLVDLVKKDGFLPIIKNYNFDWQKDLIASLLRNFFSKSIFKKTSKTAS